MSKIELRPQDRNKIAAVLSVIPGLGHLYKHHYVEGFSILFFGNALMVFVALLLGLATFGLSIILVPVIYCSGVVLSAYSIDDWHGTHPYLHPWRN